MSTPNKTQPDANVAVVKGTLTSDPRTRILPSGSTVLNYEVTTVDPSGERTSVPVSWIDPSRPPAVKIGDHVTAVGKVRRRFFRAGGATQSRTEVVADLVVRSGSVRAAKAIDNTVAPLQGREFTRTSHTD